MVMVNSIRVSFNSKKSGSSLKYLTWNPKVAKLASLPSQSHPYVAWPITLNKQWHVWALNATLSYYRWAGHVSNAILRIKINIYSNKGRQWLNGKCSVKCRTTSSDWHLYFFLFHLSLPVSGMMRYKYRAEDRPGVVVLPEVQVFSLNTDYDYLRW